MKATIVLNLDSTTLLCLLEASKRVWALLYVSLNLISAVTVRKPISWSWACSRVSANVAWKTFWVHMVPGCRRLKPLTFTLIWPVLPWKQYWRCREAYRASICRENFHQLLYQIDQSAQNENSFTPLPTSTEWNGTMISEWNRNEYVPYILRRRREFLIIAYVRSEWALVDNSCATNSFKRHIQEIRAVFTQVARITEVALHTKIAGNHPARWPKTSTFMGNALFHYYWKL